MYTFMPTTNKPLTIYPEERLYRLIEDYCIQNRLTRKDGRATIATGIIKLIEKGLDIHSTTTLPNTVPSLSREEIVQLVEEKINLTRTITVQDDEIKKKIEVLEKAIAQCAEDIAKLKTQENAPIQKLDESTSQLGEKEIIPILSPPKAKITLDPEIQAQIEKNIAERENPDLDERIQLIIHRYRGQTVSVSNLFRLLDIVKRPSLQQKAKKILENYGCTQIKVASSNGNITSWKITNNKVWG